MTDQAFQIEVREALDELRFQLAEAKRKTAMVLRAGTVTGFTADNKAVCDLGFGSHPIDVGSHVGHWNPLAVGQQIMALCPDGDPSNAQIVAGGYCQGFIPPSTRDDEQAFVPPGGGTDETAALRVRKGGMVRIEVKDIDTFKILIGDQCFRLKMNALEPTEKD